MEGARLDVLDPSPPRAFRVPAAELLRALPAEGGWPLARRRGTVPPVLRVADRFVTGQLDLRAVELNYLLEFERCRFEEPPDLRQGRLAGVQFTGCWLPGLLARNLSSANEFSLVATACAGPVDLTDADVAGSLSLQDTCIAVDGGDAPALHADRLKLAGALLAHRIEVRGELRMAGAQIGGNANFNGGELDNPGGYALRGNGIRVGGNLVLGGGTARGTVSLVNAQVEAKLTLRGTVLSAGRRADVELDQSGDAASTLVLDRASVNGDVELDHGFSSAGPVRAVNSAIGGTLSLSRGRFDGLDVGGGRRGRALHLDGARVDGDVTGGAAHVRGQLRMVDAVVRGSLLLDGSTVDNPRADAVLGNRSQVGSNLAFREGQVAGGVELRAVRVGANLDLRGSRVVEPGSYRHQRGRKPSVDVGGAVIGRDLICAAGPGADGPGEFTAHGGVRARRAQVGRMATFAGSVLGDRLDAQALNLLGLQVQDLVLTTASAPRGGVVLRQARCVTLEDNPAFWDATGWIDLEEFRYDSLRDPIDLRDDGAVEQRLRWLRQAMRRSYRPGPYDQFAEMLRAGGNDEHAATVLVEKQRLRYRALAEGRRWLRPLVLVWSWLQRSMVGYGYRPARALGWLVVAWLLGGAWFALGPDLVEINSDDTLPWNAWLFTIDLVVPIVDFGNKNRWQTPGVSQWIASGLIVLGWVLATTVAAGLTRMLKR
ncbi:hypothetical protein KCV87_21030 [Actinosynnema pretiosum subsp. pretiosum]|uniref:Membrane-associated oxidoreductase n=1 Tax=Actinosynnema pretiosum subsp. pretiosum TaxID=103721 RepID=A0AA45L2M5_9PSEU|nr:membrane-associated oxidoreductase [Actinosynnema pretiosum subsp. pretiosum]QUF02003.1 hypothetical protein KCV87_21030 [Actinosynnema pretiosum subsp. pretiosum]